MGYGRRYPDDEENLTNQFDVYDLLYAWCRLRVSGMRQVPYPLPSREKTLPHTSLGRHALP